MGMRTSKLCSEARQLVENRGWERFCAQLASLLCVCVGSFMVASKLCYQECMWGLECNRITGVNTCTNYICCVKIHFLGDISTSS